MPLEEAVALLVGVRNLALDHVADLEAPREDRLIVREGKRALPVPLILAVHLPVVRGAVAVANRLRGRGGLLLFLLVRRSVRQRRLRAEV